QWPHMDIGPSEYGRATWVSHLPLFPDKAESRVHHLRESMSVAVARMEGHAKSLPRVMRAPTPAPKTAESPAANPVSAALPKPAGHPIPEAQQQPTDSSLTPSPALEAVVDVVPAMID